MVDLGLLNYVKQQLKAGYSPDQVRVALYRANYQPESVEEVLAAAQKKSFIPIILGVLMLVVVAGVVIFFLQITKSPVEPTPIIPIPVPAPTPAPTPAPAPQPTPVPVTGECPDSCDDGDLCTDDVCGEDTGFVCQNILISPCCGNARCEVTESFDSCPADCSEPAPLVSGDFRSQASGLAKSNPQQAVSFCSSLSDDRDDCMFIVAEVTVNPNVCDNVQSAVVRDNCLVEFGVLNEDYSVCDKLTNQYLKESCLQLREIKAS